MTPGSDDGDECPAPDLGGEIRRRRLRDSLCLDDRRRLRWRSQESGEGNAAVSNGRVSSQKTTWLWDISKAMDLVRREPRVCVSDE
jgi:hypothetical protein